MTDEKPLKLLKRIIAASSNPGDVVLDPFCGCATACIAAEKLDRQWAGTDLSEKAYQLVRQRLARDVTLARSIRLTGWNVRDRYGRDDLAKLPNYRTHKHTLYGRQEGICNGCKVLFPFRNMTVDHVVPRARRLRRPEQSSASMRRLQLHEGKGLAGRLPRAAQAGRYRALGLRLAHRRRLRRSVSCQACGYLEISCKHGRQGNSRFSLKWVWVAPSRLLLALGSTATSERWSLDFVADSQSSDHQYHSDRLDDPGNHRRRQARNRLFRHPGRVVDDARSRYRLIFWSWSLETEGLLGEIVGVGEGS